MHLTASKMQPLDTASIIYFMGGNLGPNLYSMWLQKDGQKLPLNTSHYVGQLRGMLKYAHRRAKQ